MSLLEKKLLIKKGKDIQITRNESTITITNNGDSRGYIIVPKVFKRRKNSKFIIEFEGICEHPENIAIKLINRKAKVFTTVQLNSTKILNEIPIIFIPILMIEAKSTVTLNKFEIREIQDNEIAEMQNVFFKNKILLISPGYPSNENKYSHGFVHTRVKSYLAEGYAVDVAIVNETNCTKFYQYEDVNVIEINYHALRNVLQVKMYDIILIHFFSDKYAQILSAVDLSTTRVYLFSHGADTIYRDWNKMTARYFQQPYPINSDQEAVFKNLDIIYKRISERPNVKWVFVTEWTRKRSQELNKYQYPNSTVIPCLIDENIFKYKPKNAELRKKIFILRKFDNINSYSIDIDVRVILELSKRPFFNDLEFNIYGDGTEHDRLLEPIKDFGNVHIHKKFLNHTQIAEVHQQHGIGLFATRYDSQAVSSSEAAMSGNVIISSNIPGVRQVINPEFNTLCDVENYVEYADKIEEIYYNPDLFLELSKKMHEFIKEHYGFDKTIKKDLELFKEAKTLNFDKEYEYKKQVEDKDILLSIVVPSYNVEKYLKNTIRSVITHELSNYLEVLIINDGSKDRTAEIGREIEKYTTVDGRSIVKLIDKENGGHGSTINKGIELAKGKYFKLLDGDDYFNTDELVKLIQSLKEETADIVLTNYIEDFSETCTMNTVKNYEFMVPGLLYDLDSMSFKDYGFYDKWGPLLSTSTFKTEMLKNANVQLSEKCFYVDMELNFLAFVAAKTVKYLPYDIYVYYLGRPNQSVAKESVKRNYLDHEKVSFNLIENYYNLNIDTNKRKYLFDKMIITMIEGQYFIVMDYVRTRKAFNDLDRRLKAYPDIYNHPKVALRKVRILRMTNGYAGPFLRFYGSTKQLIRRIIHR